MPESQHPTLSLPFSARAELPNTPPLTSYLLHLISIKRSNLCVSADVHSTAALLRLAEDVGDYICVLKTHADIIDDFSEKTIKGLNEISRRKRFLIFEDRKFGDIGSMHRPAKPHTKTTESDFKPIKTDTVQSQYTRGPLSIATWAHLTNAHLFPGPSIIIALHSAATSTLTSLNQSVFTEISTGTPRRSLDDEDNTEEDNNDNSISISITIPNLDYQHTRKNSSVTAVTTISQTYEPSPPVLMRSFSSEEVMKPRDREQALQTLGPPPHARGLLLLAEMSSEGNLMTPTYTSFCLSAARAHTDFVLGFVAQQSLNGDASDSFLNFTPGVSLPPEGEEDGVGGDGLGQRWRTPGEVVGRGADVIIVGRGILGARDRGREAERYRREAWGAYEGRVGRGGGGS